MNNFRICNEINNLKKDPPTGISISVNDKNILYWKPTCYELYDY